LKPSDAENGPNCLKNRQFEEKIGRNRPATQALAGKIEADSVTRIVSSPDSPKVSGYSRCPESGIFGFVKGSDKYINTKTQQSDTEKCE
jgi:hypothetical protein